MTFNTNVAPIVNRTIDEQANAQGEAEVNSLVHDVYALKSQGEMKERWLGYAADTDKVTAANFVAFSLTGGTGGAFGAWVQIADTADLETAFRLSRLLPTNVTAEEHFRVQIAWGDTDGDTAIGAGGFTELVVGSAQIEPVNLHGPHLKAGTQVWARVACATDSADFDFLYSVLI